jgi:hypothetical protein
MKATGSDSKGWLRHGMAVRLALDMGFNLNHSSLQASRALPEVETKLRRQIYWALYCTDKLWACYTGRVCTMLVGIARQTRCAPRITDLLIAGFAIVG